MKLFPVTHSTPSRRGASGILIALGAFLLILLAFGGCAMGKYNGMVSAQEHVDGKWSEINNQYQRRSELVPQLVSTVKGAADFEQSTLQAVTEARASVGKLQMPATMPKDPAEIQKFFEAQQALGSSLSRLLVTAEKYPDLTATANFRDLQSQLEGTENRIAVARRDYIDAVKAYNLSIRKFPANLLAGSFGFEVLPQLETSAEVTQVPIVDFGAQK